MISTLNVASQAHNSCEDSLFVREFERGIYGCVSDGCSTGIKSHFTSQLICYSLESNGYFNHDITDDSLVKSIINDLKAVKILLGLSNMHLLATCTLFQYWKSTGQLKIRAFGDGSYFVDDVEHKIDQNNIPDYIGHHLDDDPKQLMEYLAKYPAKTYHSVHRFMICSDGIGNIERGMFQMAAKVDPNKLLYLPPASANYLERMWNLLKRDGYTLSDDLSIVSYVS